MQALRFILGAIALHVLLSVLYVRLVAFEHSAVEQDARFLYRGDDVHIVIEGDSHPRLDVVDKLLPGSVNIATRGEDYQKNRYRLQWLVDQRAEGIDTVLLGYDAGSFSSTRLEAFRPEFVWGRYVPFLELGRVFHRPSAYFGKWTKARIAPYAGEAETLSQWITNRRGFRDRFKKARGANVKFEWGEEVAERHFPPGTGWHPVLEASLRAIIANLKQRGIRLVLVSYPVTAEYAKAANDRGADDARRDALLAELLEPGVVDHLDYESLGWGNRKLFEDADHLGPRAARWFTHRLRKDLAEMGIVEPEVR